LKKDTRKKLSIILILILFTTVSFFVGQSLAVQSIEQKVEEVNLTCPDLNVEELVSFINIPSCPPCSLVCSGGRTFDACHLPDSVFDRRVTRRSYTGFSNIPSIFMGNELETVSVEGRDDLFVGCFYGFRTVEGDVKVHRLMGIYPGYLSFRGDNNDTFEEVQFEDLLYLVRAVNFK